MISYVLDSRIELLLVECTQTQQRNDSEGIRIFLDKLAQCHLNLGSLLMCFPFDLSSSFSRNVAIYPFVVRISA